MPDDFHADYSFVSIEPMIKSVPRQIIIIWVGGGGGGGSGTLWCLVRLRCYIIITWQHIGGGPVFIYNLPLTVILRCRHIVARGLKCIFMIVKYCHSNII